MVLEASRFCINESKERKGLNSSEKGRNDTMNKVNKKNLPLAMADRLQRATSKSNVIHHPFATTLRDRGTQNLLEIKFLDCVLSEAETNVIGGLHNNNTPGKSSSRNFKRGRRMAVLEEGNDKKPSIIRHHRNYLRKYKRQKRIPETSKKVKRKTLFDMHSKEGSMNAKKDLDPQKLLEEYNAHYKKDIMASKEKNYEVFCEDNAFDSTSSTSHNINQTWQNILLSLEKYMKKVKVIFIQKSLRYISDDKRTQMLNSNCR